MNKAILNTGVQNFIKNNTDADIVSLLLKKPLFGGVSQKELALQIESRKRARKKLPTWFDTPLIYYPKKLHIEQSSSEIAARYKSKIVSGKSLADLTGGLGVDSYYFAQKTATVSYCEIDPDLAEIAAYNFGILQTRNVETHSVDGLSFLKNAKQRFDWLYLDPSRRNEKKGKVFHLSDCSPDITRQHGFFFDHADNILLKTAPFLDISTALTDLEHVHTLHIIAIHNEVKELLWEMRHGYEGQVLVKTINYRRQLPETFEFHLNEERDSHSVFGAPMSYLYEPNSAILKSGAFKTIGQHYGLTKLHQHTHLYTSDVLKAFPGRRFSILASHRYTNKVRSMLTGMQANLSARNFPKSVAQIKKKYRMTDGGTTYLFFTRDVDHGLLLLHCEKVDEN